MIIENKWLLQDYIIWDCSIVSRLEIGHKMKYTIQLLYTCVTVSKRLYGFVTYRPNLQIYNNESVELY